MLKFHLKRHTRLLTPARRYVAADIYPQTKNNYHLQKHKEQQQQHLSYVNIEKYLWNLNRILQFNQIFNQRIVFNLESYHKNILKKFQQTFYKKSKHQYQFIKIPMYH